MTNKELRDVVRRAIGEALTAADHCISRHAAYRIKATAAGIGGILMAGSLPMVAKSAMEPAPAGIVPLVEMTAVVLPLLLAMALSWWSMDRGLRHRRVAAEIDDHVRQLDKLLRAEVWSPLSGEASPGATLDVMDGCRELRRLVKQAGQLGAPTQGALDAITGTT